MYEVIFASATYKELKKFPKNVYTAVLNIAQSLEMDVYLGKKLSGALGFIYAVHFSVAGVQYRLAYTINPKEKEVVVHFVQTRENFYRNLRRIFY